MLKTKFLPVHSRHLHFGRPHTLPRAGSKPASGMKWGTSPLGTNKPLRFGNARVREEADRASAALPRGKTQVHPLPPAGPTSTLRGAPPPPAAAPGFTSAPWGRPYLGIPGGAESGRRRRPARGAGVLRGRGRRRGQTPRERGCARDRWRLPLRKWLRELSPESYRGPRSGSPGRAAADAGRRWH